MLVAMRYVLALFVVLLLTTVTLFTTAYPNVQLNVASDGTSYDITVNGNLWLRSADTWFRSGGAQYSVAAGTLALASQSTDSGIDTVGLYNTQTFTWKATNGARFQTIFRTYWNLLAVNDSSSDESAIRAIVFEQVWVDGGSSTSSGNAYYTISSFPSFVSGNKSAIDLGYIHWHGSFLPHQIGAFSGSAANINMVSGLESGPVVLFDNTASVAAFIAPFNSFMATSLVHDNNTVHWGYMGAIDSIRVGSNAKFMIYFDDVGVRDTILRWGDVITNTYGKRRSDAQNEFIVQFLGYSTDHGGYYFEFPEPGMNYEETLLTLKNYTDSLNIPYRFMSIGSFWYYKNTTQIWGGGLVNWTARPDVFPHGLQTFHEKMGTPIMAHNRWFDTNNVYSTISGGKYTFASTTSWAIPTEYQFWDDFFHNATWGVQMYIQDWLISSVLFTDALQTDQDLGRNWLLQMGLGAAAHGVNVQYCMPLPRHALQSVEVPNVVQIRATDDYLPGNTFYYNWQIGVSSILNFALGMVPYKDNFWTTSVQPGNEYNNTEPNPSLQAYIALASTGSVAPSDRIGYANATLIMQTCRKDGKLLKPDVPAMELDTTYLRLIWNEVGPTGVATLTHTEIASYRWYALLTTNVTESYPITYTDLRIPETFDFVVVSYHRTNLNLGDLSLFNPSTPIKFPQSSAYDFTVYYLAPIPANGIVLIGEINKLMLISRVRLPVLVYTESALLAQIAGTPGEVVTLAWTLAPYNVAQTIQCTLDASGSGQLLITQTSASCAAVNEYPSIEAPISSK